jgi:hypothetical protein
MVCHGAHDDLKRRVNPGSLTRLKRRSSGAAPERDLPSLTAVSRRDPCAGQRETRESQGISNLVARLADG